MESDPIINDSIISKLGAVNCSVVRIHLVNNTVKFPTWWWADSLSGLICENFIFIGFVDIDMPLGYISTPQTGIYKKLCCFYYLGLLLVLLSNIRVVLNTIWTSALGISDYQYFQKLFLHRRLKILIY